MTNSFFQSAGIPESIGAVGFLHNQPQQVSFEESDESHFSSEDEGLNGGGGGGDEGG